MMWSSAYCFKVTVHQILAEFGGLRFSEFCGKFVWSQMTGKIYISVKFLVVTGHIRHLDTKNRQLNTEKRSGAQFEKFKKLFN